MFYDAGAAAIPVEELEGELAAQAAVVDAALARLVELVGACEERLPLGLDNMTYARWLAWRCSLLPGVARQHERLAQALRYLPLIRAAFARGELSYGKVSSLVRVANEDNEEALVALAEALTASQLQRAVGAYVRVSAEQARSQKKREFLDYFWADDGMLALRARLAPAEGALLLEALEAGRDALRERQRARRSAGLPTDHAELLALPPECRVSNAEALVAVADLALANPAADRKGGERYQVVVHVDANALRDGDGRCEVAEGHAVSSATAQRVSCDASVVELRERDGETLSLGRKRRTVSPALRRALATRDRGCRFPGCENRRFVDAHHIRHWGHGGETSLTNLVSLCRPHHTLVHDRGYTLRTRGDGELEFANEYGVPIPNVPRSPPPDPRALTDRHRRLRSAVDRKSCKNGDGDRMDLGLAVDGLTCILR